MKKKNLTIIIVVAVVLGIAYYFLKDRINLGGLPGDFLGAKGLPKTLPDINGKVVIGGKGKQIPYPGTGKYLPFPL